MSGGFDKRNIATDTSEPVSGKNKHFGEHTFTGQQLPTKIMLQPCFAAADCKALTQYRTDFFLFFKTVSQLDTSKLKHWKILLKNTLNLNA